MIYLTAFWHRPRLLVSLGAGLAAYVLLLRLGLDKAATRLLLAWDTGVIFFLILTWTMMTRSTLDRLQARADKEDEGAVLVLVLTVVAAVVSLGGIAAELQGIKLDKANEALRIALAGVTILASWLFVHTIFTLHYAHDYYAGEDARRGLDFPGDEDEPDYWDFAYFSFTIGAASQTSDVEVTARRTRRFVLAHTILSFFFNTTVLAFSINVGAGLLS